MHPSEAVRAAVVGACPDDVPVVSHARAADLAGDPGLVQDEDVLVVALDPGRTSPVEVSAVLGRRPRVLSISDLLLDDVDPAVDARLPRRRLTPRSLDRVLRCIGTPDGSAAHLDQEDDQEDDL